MVWILKVLFRPKDILVMLRIILTKVLKIGLNIILNILIQKDIKLCIGMKRANNT
jgi:hypothetical protein